MERIRDASTAYSSALYAARQLFQEMTDKLEALPTGDECDPKWDAVARVLGLGEPLYSLHFSLELLRDSLSDPEI